jgi:hypothetical protein
MVTLQEAKEAWAMIKSYAIANSSKQSFNQGDITVKLQKAYVTLDSFFSQGGSL